MKPEYNRVTVEACISGWLVTIHPGKPKEVYTRWEALVIRLRDLLTSSGIKEATND